MSTTPPSSGPTGPDVDSGSGTDARTGPDHDTDARLRRSLQSVSSVRRSSDERLVAGVCGGVARRLDVDPVLVRVLAVVLCFVGLAGLILYLAGWLLLPSDDEPRSLVGHWFSLGSAEAQVRDLGLVVAAVLALLAVVGDGGWGLGSSGPFWLLVVVGVPVAFVVWLVRRGAADDIHDTLGPDGPPPAPVSSPGAASSTAEWPGDPAGTARLDLGPTSPPTPPTEPRRQVRPEPPRRPREPYSWVPTLLGLSLTAIALAVLRLTVAPDWPAYVALALTTLGAVLVLSTFTRGGGPLVVLGVALLPLLALASVLPTLRVGEQVVRPTSASQVQSDYEHGVGRFELDLDAVSDPDDLVGRTIRVRAGIGETSVWVPEGTPVVARASVDAGDLEILDTRRSGVGQRVGPSGGSHPDALTIVVDQSLGRVVVDAR
jgi:phage shock protein PspC (stress-responsive transcriptional regulator)